jgi:4-amino-4-deoxy-L-arabinose transferase-like glycosyltransferase
VPALIASAVVPLAAAITNCLRPNNRAAALASAAVALTLLPLMRHGRLAMLDGALVSASGLLWWQLLRARQPNQQRWAGLWAGLGGSGLLLLKAPLLLPVLGAALLLLALDRLLNPHQWLALLLKLALGLLPGLAWHLLHLLSRGEAALLLWSGDGAARVLLSAGEGSALGWRIPVLKVLEGGWPWLPLWPFAVASAWRQRHTSAGRWPLGLQLAMAASVLPLRTQLPWYSHIVWLPFALLIGPLLAEFAAARPKQWLLRHLPWLWMLLGVGLLLAGAIALPMALPIALPIALPAGMGLLLGGACLLRRPASWRRLGISLMAGGWWLALLILMQGPLWHWELNEQPAVAPAAALVRQADPRLPLALWQLPERPSLSWQAQRRLLPLAAQPLGQPPHAQQLLSHHPPGSSAPVPQLANQRCRPQAPEQDGWLLWLCSPAP